MLRSSKRLITGTSETGSRKFVETASYMPTSATMNLPTGASVSNVASPAIDMPLLDGFISQDQVSLNRMYREIYAHDSVAGAAVDMLSTLPFSDFSLIGMSDEKRLAKFWESITRMKVRTLLPILSVDYLVLGKFIGTMTWNAKDKIYDSILPQNVDFCKIENVPIFGADPIVTLTFPPELEKAIRSNDPRMAQIIEKIPQHIREQMTKKGYRLEPEDLIYIGRPGTTADYDGVSIFKRILPIWLMEKALIRGTLDQVWKRQRPILHIMMGDPEWAPTAEDFRAVNDLFLKADTDPTGAIVATRDAINVTEVRRGDDFWKYPDIYEWSTTAKLRALGISEQFMTGEGTVSNVENTLSVTLQYFSAYRDRITNEMFYDKTFPTIAEQNGFIRKQSTVLSAVQEEYRDYRAARRELEALARGEELFDGYSEMGFRRELDGTFTAEISAGMSQGALDSSKYEIPRVQWHASLKPDNTQDYTTMLSTLEEKGVPIPLRMWAAAGGMNIRELMEQRDSDIKIRDQFKDWYKTVNKYRKTISGEDEGGFEGASVHPLLDREYDDSMDPVGVNHKGNWVPLSREGKRLRNERANKVLAEVAAKIHGERNAREIEHQKSKRKRTYSYAALPAPTPIKRRDPLFPENDEPIDLEE